MVGGGGQLGLNYVQICVSKSEGHGYFFRLLRSELSEDISLKLVVKIAASLNMGEKLCWILHIITYKSREKMRSSQLQIIYLNKGRNL